MVTHSPMTLNSQSCQDFKQSPKSQSQDDGGGCDKISASEFREAAFCLRHNLHTEYEHWRRGRLLRGRHSSGKDVIIRALTSILRLKLETEDGFNMDKTQISWFASLMSFATIPTCLLGGFLGQYSDFVQRESRVITAVHQSQASIWVGG